jgi:hypothetical protein
MTIYVDDSGWGSLIGGVAIGLYNDENRRFLYHILPPKLFQGRAWITHKYLDEALDSFVEMVERIGEHKKIVVCRGFMLDHIWEFLQEFSLSKRLSREEIKDPLQSLLEMAFARHLENLGVPNNSGGAHCLSYDDQVKWVKKDKKRIKFIKTGWPSWKKHAKKIKSK